jgi:hypothetical protein
MIEVKRARPRPGKGGRSFTGNAQCRTYRMEGMFEQRHRSARRRRGTHAGDLFHAACSLISDARCSVAADKGSLSAWRCSFWPGL